MSPFYSLDHRIINIPLSTETVDNKLYPIKYLAVINGFTIRIVDNLVKKNNINLILRFFTLAMRSNMYLLIISKVLVAVCTNLSNLGLKTVRINKNNVSRHFPNLKS